MDKHEEKKIKVELQGQDLIQVTESATGACQFEMIGCSELVDLVTDFKKKHGVNLKNWPEPPGTLHSAIILRDLLRKLKGTYHPPYAHDELCHCRNVSTKIVEKAILNGAHSVELVAQITSAGTACGTCRPDSEKLIQYYLNKEATDEAKTRKES